MVTSYLALDVGAARIGVAVANDVARIAAPLPALHNDDQLDARLQNLVTEHGIDLLVVGWPRDMHGNETEQTRYVEQFITRLSALFPGMTIERQDEALTSLQAEAELKQRKGGYTKPDIDSLSAVYILDDFLQAGQGAAA